MPTPSRCCCADLTRVFDLPRPLCCRLLTRSSGSNQLGSSKGAFSGADCHSSWQAQGGCDCEKAAYRCRAGGVGARRARRRSRNLRQASIKDAPVYEPAFTWTGFYVGAQVGHGWGETEFSDCCGKGASTKMAGSAAASSVSIGRRTASSSGSRATPMPRTSSAQNFSTATSIARRSMHCIRSAGVPGLRTTIGSSSQPGWAWANVEDLVHFCCGGKFSEDDTVDGWT